MTISRPNILLFMPDQLRADAVGAFGNSVAHTPNIDALAAQGTVFTNAFAQHSVCAQSRISIFTGWYPHVAGHRTLTNLLKPWEPNLLGSLKDAGYHVAWAGTRGDTFAPGVTATSTNRFGFTTKPSIAALARMHEFPNGPEHRLSEAFHVGRLPSTDEVDMDEATIATAIDWLDNGLPEPWVLFVALIAPHPPFAVAEPWYSLHDRAAVPRPTPPAPGKAQFVTALRQRYRTDRLTDEDWADIVATYYGMVSRLDDQLGRVRAAVARAGSAERTATVFFTDHGEYLGDFGLVEKWPSGVDDCLLRNPLVIHVPGAREHNTATALVELVDLLPSLLELAGVPVGHTHFGRSLIPLLTDGDGAHRDAAFAEGGFLREEEPLLERAAFPYHHKSALQHEQPELVGRVISLRTDAWTYVHRLYEPPELYDRLRDPQETENVAGQAEHAATEQSLRERALTWLIETCDVVPWEPDPRMEPALLRELLPAETG